MPIGYQIPAWLQPSDPTGNLLAGIRQGAAIGEAQAQQVQFQQQLAARQQEQQERLQAEALRRQAELETQKAYHMAQQDLERQRIAEEQNRIAELQRHNRAIEGKSTEKAARDFQAQQDFSRALKEAQDAGVPDPFVHALIKTPQLWTPGTVERAMISSRQRSATPNPVDKIEAQSVASDIRRIMKELDKASGDTGTDPSAITELQNQLQYRRGELNRLRNSGMPAMPAPQAAPQAALPAPGMPVPPIAQPAVPPAETPPDDREPSMPIPAPAMPAPAQRKAPSQKAIDYLQAHPETASDFEAKFGVTAEDFLE